MVKAKRKEAAKMEMSAIIPEHPEVEAILLPNNRTRITKALKLYNC